MSALRVLHLEDSCHDAELVRATLQRAGISAQVDRVESREAFAAALASTRYDVILAEYAPAAIDGIAALELAHRLAPDVPFVFVTGAVTDDRAVETLHRGATDFVVKERLAQLAPAILRALRDRDERVQRDRADAALQFLVNASARLASSLDLRAILGNLARIAIPALADFTRVEVTAYDNDAAAPASAGDTRAPHADDAALAASDHSAAAHVDPSFVAHVQRLRLRPGVTTGLLPTLYDDVPEERLRALAPNAEQLALLRELAPTSLMRVPMVAGGRALGSLVLAFSRSGRRHDGRDLATAQNLGERAAVAIENAHLYREVQREVRARKDLLAVVSHDLRDPMQSILMTASFLESSMADGDPLRARATAISRAAGLASRLLSDLLDLARLEADAIALDPRVQELAPIVRDGVELVASLADAKDVRIVQAVGRDATAYCDRTRILQILGNLIGNALRFTPPGGTIMIGDRLLADRGQIQIAIGDTGVGIVAADLPHVFEHYWQGGARTGGAGLGLAIVKNLVEAQGGTVSVTSEPGRGSTFAFTLNLRAPAQSHTARASANAIEVAAAPSVLVVDDDDETRISVAEVLEEAGYRTLTAANGLEALALLRREPQRRPSVILLDLKMPKMDARAFRREQERDPALAGIAVIVFSADDDIAEVATQLRVSGHLHKPMRAHELVAAVDHVAPRPRPRA